MSIFSWHGLKIKSGCCPMRAPGKLCPYCGGRVVEDICSECGSHCNPHYQYLDPFESAWQQGRFLRRLKYGKIVAGVGLALFIYSLIDVLIHFFKGTH
ncbi:hypothetical protein SAMN02745219_01065 [Desulfofundulus thermosubterraneus DSM 16057]|uniref:Uncharacterized protein n=1 Tax=Desulfofundulus thermosubterraneus DSM 16057 TaxID=1121432 RepID=A0A1M6DZE8_9FIRM|nr:hypothetical protein SAMN02745219_01065 [Desulfofundulus thermosubterraneus DSM 16057]